MIEKLREYGVDVDTGLSRCMNKEDFYLNLVDRSLKDASFEKLSSALESGDLDTAFEVAHALKGVMGNLSLTPIYDPICEITELLRSRTNMDYSEYMSTITTRKDDLIKLCEDK